MTSPQVRIGQTWRRNRDGRRFTVDEQYLDMGTLSDEDDWRLRDVETGKLGSFIFGFSIRRLYTLESESTP
jgi:hypothetical protein